MEETVPVTIFTSEEALLLALDHAQADGWAFISYEDERHGEYGAILFRQTLDQLTLLEEVARFSIRPWGELETRVTRLKLPSSTDMEFFERWSKDAQALSDTLALMDLVFSPSVWYPAYITKDRIVGFVHFETPGVATVLEATLLGLKESGLITEFERLQEGASEFPSIRKALP
jgi:hypothetical protein